MPFTNTDAAAYGLLAMHAMDMYRDHLDSLVPPAAAGLTASRWTVAGYIVGRDTILPAGGGQAMQVSVREVCYGYLARNATGEFAAVIRGTDGFVEWIEDAEFTPIHYPLEHVPAGQTPSMTVEQGFWDIYARMRLLAPDGSDRGPLAGAIAKAVIGAAPQAEGAGSNTTGRAITVVGHSLGSALATYLTFDLAVGDLSKAGLGVVGMCVFASPQTGNTAFTSQFDAAVLDYRVLNYVLDIVPRLPFGLGYRQLPRRSLLVPSTAEASIRVGLACSHHVVCYCAMLDYEATMEALKPMPGAEAGSVPCILGPETGDLSLAKQLLAELANATFG